MLILREYFYLLTEINLQENNNHMIKSEIVFTYIGIAMIIFMIMSLRQFSFYCQVLKLLNK